MKTAQIALLALACTMAAHADFSYTQTRKATGGMAAGAMAGQNPTIKHYLKGQKMKMDMGNTATIMDLEAQTITTINNTDKSYTVKTFAELSQAISNVGADIQVDVKETGQRKSINGFNASQIVMTMSMEGMQQGPPGMKMQIEMEMWLSNDVPGAAEARSFYQKNGDKMAFASMAAGNPQMQKAMATMQKKIASLGGVTVMQIVRTKMGGGNDAQAQQMQQGMQQAMAQLEAMRKAGGAQAQAAEQAMARMGGARGAAGGGALFEMTTESSDFSAAGIPDSVFAIPAGYTKK
jgi:hypothetical protein